MNDYSFQAIIIPICVGALIMVWLFRRLHLPILWGGVSGGVAGGVGALSFMLPINFCTFRPVPAEALYTIQNEDLFIGVFLIVMGMTLFLVPLGYGAQWWAGRAERKNRPAQLPQGVFKGWLLPAIFLAPTLIILLMFLYYPAIDTFGLSTQLAKLGARRSIFVCVDNFASLLIDDGYSRIVLNTFVLGIAIMVISMVLALFIATVAYLPIKGASVYRTLLIWPYAISPAVAGIIFQLMFNPAGGVINYFLNNTFGVSIGWLNDPNAAPWAIIIASVWKSLGFNILFFLAGLQNVPKDLLEAASIDGANAVRRFYHIVIPTLSPITFFLVITNLTYAFFETFGTIDYLTGGGPVESTTTMMYRIYEVGVTQNDLGKGAAQSIVLFLVVIGITVLQFRTTERNVSYGA